jgi:hypothetical protein
MAGNVTCNPVSHGDRFHICKLSNHPLVMLKITSKFFIVFFYEVYCHSLYVSWSDVTHSEITAFAPAIADWLF